MHDEKTIVEEQNRRNFLEENNAGGLFIGAIFLIILFKMFSDTKQFSKEWKEFSEDLYTKNRFSCSHNIIGKIASIIENCRTKIYTRKKLYRARKIYSTPIIQTLSEDEWIFLKLLFLNKQSDDSSDSILHDEKIKKFFDEFRKCQESNFWGFDKPDSGAPPSGESKSGRFNPQGISYLSAESHRTAIAEVSPLISEDVSVALLKPKRTLNIVDFTKLRKKSQKPADFAEEYALADTLSKVALMKDKDYLPMQYIAEFIKNSQIDGIRYSSSLHTGGTNIVFFDPNCCDVISSKVYSVENIFHKIKQKLPFRPDEEAIIMAAASENHEELEHIVSSATEPITKWLEEFWIARNEDSATKKRG